MTSHMKDLALVITLFTGISLVTFGVWSSVAEFQERSAWMDGCIVKHYEGGAGYRMGLKDYCKAKWRQRDDR